MSRTTQSSEQRVAKRWQNIERLGAAAAAQGCEIVVDEDWMVGLQCLLTNDFIAAGSGIDFTNIRDQLDTMAEEPRN